MTAARRQRLRLAIDEARRERLAADERLADLFGLRCAGCGGELCSLVLGCRTCRDRWANRASRARDPYEHAHARALLRANASASHEEGARKMRERSEAAAYPFPTVGKSPGLWRGARAWGV